MSEEKQEKLMDLLIKKAVEGLDETEQRELDALDANMADEFHSLEMTVAAISVAGLPDDEPLPAHLRSKIAADSAQFVSEEMEAASPWPPVKSIKEEGRVGTSWFGWLGWAAAAAACVALALNIWSTRTKPDNIAKIIPPAATPRILTAAEKREEMMRSNIGMVKANWVAKMKEMNQVSGDVIWSDEKQAGYMRFKGLPVNDVAKSTYQLWIFDKTQDKATPIDGGTFDVTSDGEVVIPINAKLKAQGAEMFAITIEKPGGVVVSKRDKLAALAMVEHLTS